MNPHGCKQNRSVRNSRFFLAKKQNHHKINSQGSDLDETCVGPALLFMGELARWVSAAFGAPRPPKMYVYKECFWADRCGHFFFVFSWPSER